MACRGRRLRDSATWSAVPGLGREPTGRLQLGLSAGRGSELDPRVGQVGDLRAGTGLGSDPALVPPDESVDAVLLCGGLRGGTACSAACLLRADHTHLAYHCSPACAWVVCAAAAADVCAVRGLARKRPR